MTKLIKSIGLLLTGLALVIFFSPFEMQNRYQRQAIYVSTTIDASPCQVFEYLGNSDNAQSWSSFVSHIKTLEGTDGTVGSLRRCYKDAEEENEQWDEETVLVEPCKKRRLTIFNLQNFPTEASGLVTEQIYELAEGGKCKLSFTLFFQKGHNTFWQQFKMHVFSYYIKSVFDTNLKNINRFASKASIVEQH